MYKSNKYAIIVTKIVPFYFSCNVCDTLFNTSMSLEYHKEEFGHWTSDEDDYDEDEEIGKILTKPLRALKLRIRCT